MEGNLSKKKGFLSDINETDIQSIADVIGERTDARLDSAEIAISDINDEKIPELKDELTEYTDDLVNEAYAGVESLEKTVKGKEDISNKRMVSDDDGSYYSGEMTEMRIHQVIGDHIVQDLNEPKEDRIPSVKAVSEAIKGIKPDIALSDYYTKEEANMKHEELLGSIQVAENEINTLFGEALRLEEEIGDIAEATAAIIALQNKYVGGESA